MKQKKRKKSFWFLLVSRCVFLSLGCFISLCLSLFLFLSPCLSMSLSLSVYVCVRLSRGIRPWFFLFYVHVEKETEKKRNKEQQMKKVARKAVQLWLSFFPLENDEKFFSSSSSSLQARSWRAGESIRCARSSPIAGGSSCAGVVLAERGLL